MENVIGNQPGNNYSTPDESENLKTKGKGKRNLYSIGLLLNLNYFLKVSKWIKQDKLTRKIVLKIRSISKTKIVI